MQNELVAGATGEPGAWLFFLKFFEHAALSGLDCFNCVSPTGRIASGYVTKSFRENIMNFDLIQLAYV